MTEPVIVRGQQWKPFTVSEGRGEPFVVYAMNEEHLRKLLGPVLAAKYRPVALEPA